QDERHKETLALNVFGSALLQDSFEQHTFVGNMLVDDPKALVIDGKDERLANLAQWFERTQRRSELAGNFRLIGKCGSTGVVGNDLRRAGQRHGGVRLDRNAALERKQLSEELRWRQFQAEAAHLGRLIECSPRPRSVSAWLRA